MRINIQNLPFGYVKWVANKKGKKINVRDLVAYGIHSIKLFNGTKGATVTEIAQFLSAAGYTYKTPTIRQTISQNPDMFPSKGIMDDPKRPLKDKGRFPHEYSVRIRDVRAA